MMIGPAPMMRMLWMSVRFGIAARAKLHRNGAKYAKNTTQRFLCVPLRSLRLCGEAFLFPSRLGARLLHHAHEAIEQVGKVVRAGACFRMSLEAERRFVGQRNALQRAVEE